MALALRTLGRTVHWTSTCNLHLADSQEINAQVFIMEVVDSVFLAIFAFKSFAY